MAETWAESRVVQFAVVDLGGRSGGGSVGRSPSLQISSAKLTNKLLINNSAGTRTDHLPVPNTKIVAPSCTSKYSRT